LAITSTQLRAFLAVVRTGSVTAAADELVVTQPSVSAAVTALSREVGVSLIERVGRSVQPTAAGHAFTPYAADLLGLYEQGPRAAREAAGLVQKEVRLAAVTTAGEYLVPSLVEVFAASDLGISLSVEVGNRTHVFDRVRRHEVDLGIGGRPPRHGGIAGTFLLDNPVVVITSPSDPLAHKATVTIEELGERTWLLREEGSGTRTMTEDFLAHHELDVRRLTMGSNGAIRQAARVGIGVSLQSLLAVHMDLELGTLGALRVEDQTNLGRAWYLLQAAKGPTRPSVAAFLDFLHGPDGARALRRAHDMAAAIPGRVIGSGVAKRPGTASGPAERR
jgi:DNA-binding transcriptional LysR family regulator